MQGAATEEASEPEKATGKQTGNPGDTSGLVRAAINKARRNKDLLQQVWDDVQTLIRLFRAWRTGEYRKVPWKTMVYTATALVYFVNPLDIIPDFLPMFGFLDDAAVISFVVRAIKTDLDRFARWEAAKR